MKSWTILILLLSHLMMPAPSLPGDLNDRAAEWTDVGGFRSAPPGLKLRLSALRTDFQAWELPKLVLEVRNETNAVLTAETLRKIFADESVPDGLQVLVNDSSSLRSLLTLHACPWSGVSAGIDIRDFIGLRPGVERQQTMTLHLPKAWYKTSKGDGYRSPGRRCEFIMGVAGEAFDRELKSNRVTLTMLPPGVRDRQELAGWLKPHVAGGQSILAGFVPNKTTVVWGEPMFATFVVENRDETPFTFEFGGDYRGLWRHNRFKIQVIGPDRSKVADPCGNRFDEGGLGYARTVKANDTTIQTVRLLDYRAIAGPGKYLVKCRFTLEPSEVEVMSTYELTILPREPEHVKRVLEDLFDESYQTGGMPFIRLIDTISAFGLDAAVADLAKMGTGGDVEHRVAAAVGLGKVGSTSALEALVEMGHDPVLEVRAAVISALGAYKDRWARD